ncbi:hypothetical protein HAX54_041343 [Datura stramonium]|uniref:Uncharacterized protein n=1 Tax=Datura stramonium TaxID=4076 RepID=A0ABS8SLC9_DATST|nr:hypothetical protein [Datura stramonium]
MGSGGVMGERKVGTVGVGERGCRHGEGRDGVKTDEGEERIWKKYEWEDQLLFDQGNENFGASRASKSILVDCHFVFQEHGQMMFLPPSSSGPTTVSGFVPPEFFSSRLGSEGTFKESVSKSVPSF